jgi:hypothetical protein
MPSTNQPAVVSHNLPGQPTKFDPDEIFRRIDQLRHNFGPEPGLLEQILSPGARRVAAAIHDAAASAVNSRRVMIDAMSECIKTYVDVHRGDLKIRGAAYVLETCARQSKALHVILEDAYISNLENYSHTVARIDSIPNLTPQQKEDQKQRAYRRAEDNMAAGQEQFNDALNVLVSELQSIMREIGA